MVLQNTLRSDVSAILKSIMSEILSENLIANYYQRTLTIIQSNSGGFLHNKDIIQQKQQNIILNKNIDMLNYSKCTLRTVGYH